jgi:predicted RNase H-like HicB family nuclease
MLNFHIKYSYDITTNQYIAEIPEFNISDFWDTLEEAENNLKKWLELYFQELKEMNYNNKNKFVEYA